MSSIFDLNMHVQSICDPARGLLITVWQAAALSSQNQVRVLCSASCITRNPQYKMLNLNLMNTFWVFRLSHVWVINLMRMQTQMSGVRVKTFNWCYFFNGVCVYNTLH